MNYTVRVMHAGRVHEVFAREYVDAVTVFEALAYSGYTPELWRGTEKLR